MEMCKKTRESEMRHLPAISIYGYVGGRQIYALWAIEWAWQPFIQSIGIDETNKFQLKFFSIMQILGSTGLGVLWALEWSRDIRVHIYDFLCLWAACGR